MTTFYLIRHGLNDFVGNALAGWSPGVHLNAEGRAQATKLALRLRESKLAKVYTSPLDRARETAAALAESLGVEVEIRDALGEVHFGEWTLKTFAELNSDPRWARFNSYRSGTRVPGGESAIETQGRIVAELEALRGRHPDDTVAVVSHSDTIRAALAYYLGIPIDLYQRMECRPASYSIVRLSDDGPLVCGFDHVAE